jgi:hypothetical protein
MTPHPRTDDRSESELHEMARGERLNPYRDSARLRDMGYGDQDGLLGMTPEQCEIWRKL